MYKQLLLFDGDETLWTTPDKDYISSVASDFIPVSQGAIMRVADGKLFFLRPGVSAAFAYLHKLQGAVAVGIVSDNAAASVSTAVRLFGLADVIDKAASNVKLWTGYCPKHEMILEVMERPQFRSLSVQHTCLIDDKDYSAECASIGVSYMQVTLESDMATTVKHALSRIAT